MKETTPEPALTDEELIHLAPRLEAEGWQNAERIVRQANWGDADEHAECQVEQARALLAYRGKVAAGIRSGVWRYRLYQACTGRPRPLISCSTWRVLLRRGLVYSPDRRTAEATDYEIARVTGWGGP